MTSRGSSDSKRRGSREHLVEHRPQRVEVAASVDDAVGAPELLGRRIAEERAAEPFARVLGVRDRRPGRCAVEVDQRRGAAGVEHDVGRVDVAMDHVAGVHVSENLREAEREIEKAVDVERLSRPVTQRRDARVLDDEHRHRANRPEGDDLLDPGCLDALEHRGLVQERRDRRRVLVAWLDRLFDDRAPLRPDRPAHDKPPTAIDFARLRQGAPFFPRTLHRQSSSGSTPRAGHTRFGAGPRP